jgi:methylated-DNA-[protein]-cysteine S-methyltransferase
VQLQIDRVETPIGEVVVVANTEALVALDFVDCKARMDGYLATRFGAVQLKEIADPAGFSARVRAYFSGVLDALDDAPVQPGGTSFQREVWHALRSIRVGETTSYGKLAQRLGRASAARAVGGANALNPIALAIPCHRVIGADGSLTGYAGGVERKHWLLRHERALSGGSTTPSRILDPSFD